MADSKIDPSMSLGEALRAVASVSSRLMEAVEKGKGNQKTRVKRQLLIDAGMSIAYLTLALEQIIQMTELRNTAVFRRRAEFWKPGDPL